MFCTQNHAIESKVNVKHLISIRQHCLSSVRAYLFSYFFHSLNKFLIQIMQFKAIAEHNLRYLNLFKMKIVRV